MTKKNKEEKTNAGIRERETLKISLWYFGGVGEIGPNDKAKSPVPFSL